MPFLTFAKPVSIPRNSSYVGNGFMQYQSLILVQPKTGLVSQIGPSGLKSGSGAQIFQASAFWLTSTFVGLGVEADGTGTVGATNFGGCHTSPLLIITKVSWCLFCGIRHWFKHSIVALTLSIGF